ncbi:hypothetical protein ACSSS7_006753 [Eimeria intestinalis]
MRQQPSQQQQHHRREQQQLRHQQQQLHQQEQCAVSFLQGCTRTDARESSARDMPAEPNAPQYSLNSGALALFAPSTRTPPPTQRPRCPKFEERWQLGRACEATPATFSRMPRGQLAETAPHLDTQCRQLQHPRKHQNPSHKAEARRNQRAAQTASESALLTALTPQQNATDTTTLLAEIHHQHKQHGRTAGGRCGQSQGAKTGTADIVHRQTPERHASGDALNLYDSGCHRARPEKGKRGADYWKRRKTPAIRQQQSEDVAQYGGVPTIGLLNAVGGESWPKCRASRQKASALGGTLHADRLLDMPPLLLAKVLQMLSAETAKAFGSTCRKARRLLRSHCCIVSLSARHMACLLALPPAALRRQLPFFSGLKTIELELSPAVTSQLCLGSGAAAAAVVAGVSLRTRSVAHGRGLSGTMDTGAGTQHVANQRADSRERQVPIAERHGQYHQQESARARDSAITAPGGLAGNQASTSPSHYLELFRGRGLDATRLQPFLFETAAASRDALDAVGDNSISPWSTAASASASMLLEHLIYLKSISARLKLAGSRAPGESEAATELLLLLQLLIHRNAHSLVSLKIAVDVPPSSTVWRRIPPLLLPPSLPVLKSLHIDFPFQTFMCGGTATVEVCDEAFEFLKTHMGEGAPATLVDEAATVPVPSRAADFKVVAYLLYNDDCIVATHQDGNISFIRRKARPGKGSPSRLPKGRQKLVHRHELSALSGGTVLYEASPGLHGRSLEEQDAGASDISRENLILAERHQRGPLRPTSPPTGFPGARILHHLNMTTTGGQQQQLEKRTQQLLVRALQHLVGIAAESLQLLDIDGEVRHFSVLYENLHFKCLRRLSLGWTITPELQQLLYLFSSRKLRTLQKLNFNGPAQIHPDTYIHISYVSRIAKTSDADQSDVSWLEPFSAALDEATLRRSAGLNNYGLGQIHLQLYALLNCGSCSVSETEYARQQLVQQQFLLLKSEKKVKAILKQIEGQRDPLGLDALDTSESAAPVHTNMKPEGINRNDCLEVSLEQKTPEEQVPQTSDTGIDLHSSPVKIGEELQQQKQRCRYAALKGSASLPEAPSPGKSTTGRGSCRHRVHQAGSWLWRAFPSHFLGLAGPRAASAISHNTRASNSQTNLKEIQGERSLRALIYLPGTPSARELSTMKSHSTDKANYHKRSLALNQSQDNTVVGGVNVPPIGSDPNSASKITATALAPRPKRRRLVGSHPATQGASARTDHGRLRRQLLAFAREHLPLLGDLICPHLESLAHDTEVFLERLNTVPPILHEKGDAASEYEVHNAQAAMNLLKSVSSFLLDAAGDNFGTIRVEGRCARATKSILSSRHMPGTNLSIPSTSPLATSSWNSREDSHAPLKLPSAGFFPRPQLHELHNRSCLKQGEQPQDQGHQKQLDHQQVWQQQDGKEVDDFEVDEIALLHVLQHPPPPRSSWSHGVFFKYAFVDLDFECLVTFRVCLCHHPLFIFYKEHEKGLHVLHVDGVFHPGGDGAQEKKELWKERLAYTYICDPAVPFQQTSGHQGSRRQRRSMQDLDTAPADTGAGTSSFRALQSLTSDNRETETSARVPSATVDRFERLLVDADVSGGCDLFCLEMWAVLSLCRDQMSPPTLPQYIRALKRLWNETLTQQQRDIYDNIITPKYIARRLRTPDLTFEALPPWWQQPKSSRSPEGG